MCTFVAKIAQIEALSALECSNVMKDDTCEIFTLDDVATFLKVGKRTIYRLVAAKKIPAFKVGGTWRFSRVDIEQWIKLQSQEGVDNGRAGGGATND